MDINNKKIYFTREEGFIIWYLEETSNTHDWNNAVHLYKLQFVFSSLILILKNQLNQI